MEENSEQVLRAQRVDFGVAPSLMDKSEVSQALARVALTFLASLYVFFLYILESNELRMRISVIIGVSYTLGAVLWWVYVRNRSTGSDPPIWRKNLAIIGDTSLVTTGLMFAGTTGVGLYAVYVWIIFGNGYRYGVREMTFATLCAVAGLAWVSFANPAWTVAPISSAGLMVGLLIIYFFYRHARLAQQAAETVLAKHAGNMERIATHDTLTGLPNRRLFDQELDLRVGCGEPFALLIYDLNRFKSVNDSYGHDAGDFLLQSVARRSAHHIRHGLDMLARLGGDEFAAIMVNATEEAAQQFAKRIRHSLGQQFNLPNDVTVEIGVSVGLAMWPRDATTAEKLFRAADQAMYRDKQHGIDCTQKNRRSCSIKGD